jgi:hypothetical protein
MSGPKRAYDMLRGYVSSEWERIKDVERSHAEVELSESLLPPVPKPTPMPVVPLENQEDIKTHARRLLGVGEECSFAEVRKAFTRLNKRSDPANFPSGSPEAAKAAEIQKKVTWAYTTLTEGMDATERRFRTLELD